MLKILKNQTHIINLIRSFFERRQVLEVHTPVLSRAGATAVHLSNLEVEKEHKYLQTSPEYHMKRLLVEGSGDIYQICPAFRGGENGRFHNTEFTILEWYRMGFNHHQLMDEMDELLQFILKISPAKRYAYQEIFEKYLNLNPHLCDLLVLQNKVKELKINNLDYEDRNLLLQLLMTHKIEPQFGKGAVFIYDYPVAQAMLSHIRDDHPPVAERFEVYVNGIELANGFHELSNAHEQRKRFEEDLKERHHLGLPAVPIDENLLKALEKGLPDCSGVALGVDRLIMLAFNQSHIRDVIAFPFDKA